MIWALFGTSSMATSSCVCWWFNFSFYSVLITHNSKWVARLETDSRLTLIFLPSSLVESLRFYSIIFFWQRTRGCLSILSSCSLPSNTPLKSTGSVYLLIRCILMDSRCWLCFWPSFSLLITAMIRLHCKWSHPVARGNWVCLSFSCWSSYNSGFLWALVIPFLLLIFVSRPKRWLWITQHVVLGQCGVFHSLHVWKSSHDEQQPSVKVSLVESLSQLRYLLARLSLRITSSISMLFGLTWLIGLFYLSDRSPSREYLFAIFNVSHAVLMFIFFCLLKRHIREFLRQCSFDQTYLYSKYHSVSTSSLPVAFQRWSLSLLVPITFVENQFQCNSHT